MNKRQRTVWKTVLIAAAAILLLGRLGLPGAILRRYYPQKYQEEVDAASREFCVPSEMIYAVIKAESNFDTQAVSAKGAVGLMQLMPDTYVWLKERLMEPAAGSVPTDAGENIRIGAAYLSFLYEKYGNWDTVAAAYNAGHGRVDRWLARGGDGVPPIAETQKYVRKVRRARESYRALYAS